MGSDAAAVAAAAATAAAAADVAPAVADGNFSGTLSLFFKLSVIWSLI